MSSWATAPAQPATKVAVVLSGCGYLDGTEITEAASALIALSEYGAVVHCFAPNENVDTAHYLEATPHTPGKRNMLEESARIARRNVSPLSDLREQDFDAVVFPGGSGAAKNLSNWATQGAKATVLEDVARVIKAFHKASKPIGAICIAPAVIARVLGAESIEVTIGSDAATASEIEKTGAQHTRCEVSDYVSDRDHKVLTTPAYMYEHATPHEVFTGVRRMIKELVEMA